MNCYFSFYRNPTGEHAYSSFDVPHEQQEIITDADRIACKPKTFVEVMKDVVVFVDVRSGDDDRATGIKNHIMSLGVNVNDKLLR